MRCSGAVSVTTAQKVVASKITAKTVGQTTA